MSEKYKNYRSVLMDAISPTYCAAKWLNATIWLGSGMTSSCHHPLPHRIDLRTLDNPANLHNTPHKKQMRKLMLEGERPQECDYCWRVEDIDPDLISDRVFKTIIHSDEDIAKTTQMPWDAPVNPRTLEISFDRACQFACSYCNPSFSTTWAKDIKDSGSYRNTPTDDLNHYTNTHGHAQRFKHDEHNPYVEAFWRWWPSLSEDLVELRVTGGEPTMSTEFWRLLDECKGKRMRLAVNSNLGIKPQMLANLIDRAADLRHFELYTSNESYGAHAEYIRDGLIWDDWKSNLVKVIESGNFKKVHVMMTINALCLLSITDFLSEMVDLKKRYGGDFPCLSLNYVRTPRFQSIHVLPQKILLPVTVKLQSWFKENSAALADFERDSVLRLIALLKKGVDKAEQPTLEMDFKAFFEQYDARRGKSFVETFPTIKSWYDGIKY